MHSLSTIKDWPTLPDGSTQLTGSSDFGFGDLGSPRYGRLAIKGYTWFIDHQWYQPAEITDSNAVYTNKTPGRKYGETLLIEFDRVINPDSETDTGAYVQAAGYAGGDIPAPLIRINSFPTLYLNLKLSQFQRRIAHKIVQDHPVIEEERSFFGNTITAKDCPKGKFDSIWISRSDLKEYNKARGIAGPNVGEPMFTGNLALGISRTIARHIRSRSLPITPPELLNQFPGFWEFRQKEATPLCSFVSETGERQYVAEWAPLTTPMLDDEEELFILSDLAEIADEAWIYANQLEILKDRIEQSKIDNCSDRSSLGRLRIACRFAQSARQRLRTIYGLNARAKFDSSEWADRYAEELMSKILDFQTSNPGIVFHIDHIIPLAALPEEDVATHEGLAWHPCNLQILSAADNISKGSRFGQMRHRRSNADPAQISTASKELRKLHEAYAASASSANA